MDKERSIRVLSILNKIHNNRAQNYKLALKQTKDAGLRTLFRDFIITSSTCRQQLAGQMLLLGVKPQETGGFTGKFFQPWQTFVAAMAGNNRLAILRFCEEEGSMVAAAYNGMLQKSPDGLSEYQRRQVMAQYGLVKTGLETVKNILKSGNEIAGR